MTNMAAIKANRITKLRRALAKERLWIKEHGGSRDAYVARYGSAFDEEHYGDGGEAIWGADAGALLSVESGLADLENRSPRTVSEMLEALIIESADLSYAPDDETNRFTVSYDGIPVGRIYLLGDGGFHPRPIDGTEIAHGLDTLSQAVEAMATHLSNVGSEDYFNLARERHNAQLRLHDVEGRTRLAQVSFNTANNMLRAAARPA